MALGNAQEVLELYNAVNAAIRKILAGGQSATIEGNSVTRADLERLKVWRNELKEEYAELTGDGSRIALFDFTGGRQ